MPDTNTDINYSVGHTLISVRINFLSNKNVFPRSRIKKLEDKGGK